MKLRKIKWKSYNILDCLELDLTLQNAREADTIIIVGENGTGKTTILRTLYNFINKRNITPFEYVEYSIDNAILRAEPCNNERNKIYAFNVSDINTGKEKSIFMPPYGNESERRLVIEDPKNNGAIYSKHTIYEEHKEIKSTSIYTLDEDIYNEKANKDDETYIKQVLIDVQADDDAALGMLARASPCTLTYKDFEKQSKMRRFSNAFDNFFKPVIKYKGVDRHPNGYDITFTKNDIDISIDYLSSGEKQIVFKGTFLLKNIGTSDKSIIFIDEPEISMHPAWQCKILSYFKDIFTIDNKQINQIIVATHSPYIVEQAINDDKSKIIMLKSSNNGKSELVEISKPQVLLEKSISEIIYQTFNICTTDYHNLLYSYIELKLNDNTNKHLVSQFYKDPATKTLYKRPLEANKYNPNKKTHVKYVKDGITYFELHEEMCLSKKIRNLIHHPENKLDKYTNEELKESIGVMRKFITSHLKQKLAI